MRRQSDRIAFGRARSKVSLRWNSSFEIKLSQDVKDGPAVVPFTHHTSWMIISLDCSVAKLWLPLIQAYFPNP